NLLPMTRIITPVENPQKPTEKPTDSPSAGHSTTARHRTDTQKKRPGEALNSPHGAPDALQTLHQSLHHP
ncbi:hypothetical protein, partial [uncultured Duncaniella sp.]